MDNILYILENQKEVQHLTYFISRNRLGILQLKLATLEINKNYKFKDETACLNKIIDILFELKRKESWSLKRMEKNK